MPTTNITVPLTSIGGTPPYTYAVVAGVSTTFPGTTTINNTLKTLFLDAAAVGSGTYTIKLQVTDAATPTANTFFTIITVVVDDPTIFSILNDNQSFAPGSFPQSFSIPLISNGGNGATTWSIIPSITTLNSPTIDASNNLKFTLTSFGSFTVGLNAVDSIGNSVSTVVTYSINSSTVFSLVDGQIEALVNVPVDSLGTHHFTATVRDSATSPDSVTGTVFYQALQPISVLHIPEAYFDHYWAANDQTAIVFPVVGDFTGFSLGTPTVTQPTNGLILTVDGVNKIVKVQGPPTLFQNSEVRIPLPILQGTTQVAVVSREYTLLSDNISNNGADFVFNSFPRPYIVGDSIGLNPLKPYFNSPNISKNVNYSARVQSGSALPLGVSLDANTSLVYGTVASTTPATSVIEYVDAQNIVHGTVTITWTIYNSGFTLQDNLVAAQIQVPYPTATSTTNCISSNSPSPLATVSLAHGVLPAGLAASVDVTINPPNGVVKFTGTPTEAGYFDIWFQVTNTNNEVAYLYKRFTSNYLSPLVILTQQIPALVTGQPYTFSLQGFGGIPPYTWSSPQWPGGSNATFPGLTLSTAGVISGTTSAADHTSQNDTFVLTDATGTVTNAVLNVNVNDTLRISTTILPIIVPGQPYSFAMSALGGTAPYTWASSPTVPPPAGITFNSSGIFSGVTSATISTTLSITVTDSAAATANASFTFQTGAATGLQIDTTGVGTVNRGVAYQGHLREFGPGTAPFTWQVPPSSPNVLPTGLNLTADLPNQGVTATISGTYSGSPFSNLPVEVEVTDVNGNSAFAYMLLTTGTDLVITTPSLPSGTITAAYTTNLAASGGVPPYTFSLDGASPALPSGFSLSSSGVLAGTTGSAFNQNLVFDVHDNMSPSNNAPPKTLNLLIQASTLNITNASLPNATGGAAYSQTLTATGGTTPYTWSIAPSSASTLPAGLTLNASTGVISGTTTTTGSRTVTFRVTDHIGAFFDKALGLTVITGLTMQSGIDNTNGLTTNSLGYIANGNVGSINPRPNFSFYVVASGVLSTNPSALTVTLGGLAGASATVLSIVSGVATIQLTGPFQSGTLGSNNLTVTLTDMGVTVSKTFTWTVYTNPQIKLAPGTGTFPTLSSTFGGTGQVYIPLLEGTTGHIYAYNAAAVNTNPNFNFQTYNAAAVDKPTAASKALGFTATNTEWNGRLAISYDPAAFSGAGSFEFGYNGAGFDANVVNTVVTIFDEDIAWYQSSNKSYDTYTISGANGGSSQPIQVNYLFNPNSAGAVTVSPLSVQANNTKKTFTITFIKPLPPLQSDTIATVSWSQPTTTNSIVPIFSNGIPGSTTSYGVVNVQTASGHVQNGGAGSRTCTATFGTNTTSGNTLVVSATTFDFAGGGVLANPTISDNLGNVYTRRAGYVAAGSEVNTFVWTAPVTAPGHTIITLSFTTNQFNSFIALLANEINGMLAPVSQDGVTGTSNVNSGTTASSGTTVTSNPNDVIFSVICNVKAASVVPGTPAGYSNLGSVTIPQPNGLSGADPVHTAAFLKVAATGSYSPTWSVGTADTFGVTLAFQLNPVVTLVPNNSGIVGYTIQATPATVATTQTSILTLTLHGVITYLSGDTFVTNDHTYMSAINVASVTYTH